MKIAGYIVEQMNVFHLGKRKQRHEWVRYSSKLYETEEIAQQAYRNNPYGGTHGYNMMGRMIPVYRFDENEKPKIIKKS